MMRVCFRHPEPGETDWERILGMGVATPLAAVLAIMLRYDLLPRCLFAQIAGIPCPFCESGHAAQLLFDGRFFQAFTRQPLMSLALATGLFFILYSWVVVLAGLPRLRVHGINRWHVFRIGMLVVLANWCYLILCRLGRH